MQIARTANPALDEQTFTSLPAVAGDDVMTLGGTVGKSTILVLLLLTTASWTWDMHFGGATPDELMPYMIGGALGGFVLALITVFKKS